MSILKIAFLAILQGFAELLPVSSSAHVILAQKLMGLDPSAPEMTFLLVMLHTGTMFAVLVYFGKRWLARVKDKASFQNFAKNLVIATAATGVLGFALKLFIEKIILEHILGYPKGEVEALFKILPLIAISLTVAGVLIIISGRKKTLASEPNISNRTAVILGLVQGLCLPFRGLSRSGVTISTGILKNIPFQIAEEFSFALAVLLTPPVVVLQFYRLMKSNVNNTQLSELMKPGLLGLVFSFLAGLLALKWLSSWLEKGRWQWFGYYCLALAVVTMGVHWTT